MRFTSTDGAKTALADVVAKKIKFGEADVQGRILEGNLIFNFIFLIVLI